MNIMCQIDHMTNIDMRLSKALVLVKALLVQVHDRALLMLQLAMSVVNTLKTQMIGAASAAHCVESKSSELVHANKRSLV